MHRFFVPAGNVEGDEIQFTPAQARQISRVLRLRSGDEVQALDNSGACYLVQLQETGQGRAFGRITGKEQAPGEPATRVHLSQGLLKGEKWGWVLQKGTEVGISAFRGLVCARSVPRRDAKAWDSRARRWSAIVQEAAEQSGRGIIPEVLEPATWEDACRAGAGSGLLLHEGEMQIGLRDGLVGLKGQTTVLLLAGPEGGLTNEEVLIARDYHIPAVSLGPRILRAETAGVIAAALVLFERGEMQRR
ncbi:MAG: Ribosomal small subunit methyltransferase [Dehalococcoidia bacterium]|nr:Ribosomal small subunit methyltransferase [Dehalococcoidia bacterium]